MIGGVDGYKWNITDSYDNNLNQRNNVNNKDELGQKGAVDKSKTTECQTCKNRKYVDGSNEANVSFKNAAHISPAFLYSCQQMLFFLRFHVCLNWSGRITL